MNISFREVDPFNCWIWLRFSNIPTDGEKSYIDGVFDSWYVIGRLGGFNGQNIQVHDEGGDWSHVNYDNEEANNNLPSLMHNLGQMEYQSEWARCWVDFGTADALALDVLINSLRQLNTDIVQLEEIIIGGFNEDWPVDSHPDAIFPSN